MSHRGVMGTVQGEDRVDGELRGGAKVCVVNKVIMSTVNPLTEPGAELFNHNSKRPLP